MNTNIAPARGAHAIAAIVVGVEGAVLALAAILYVVLWAVGNGSGRGLSLGLAGIAAVAAAGLGALARGLWHGRRWAVAPALTWQILQGLAGLLLPGNPPFTVASVALAIVGAVSLILVARSNASGG